MINIYQNYKKLWFESHYYALNICGDNIDRRFRPNYKTDINDNSVYGRCDLDKTTSFKITLQEVVDVINNTTS